MRRLAVVMMTSYRPATGEKLALRPERGRKRKRRTDLQRREGILQREKGIRLREEILLRGGKILQREGVIGHRKREEKGGSEDALWISTKWTEIVEMAVLIRIP